MDNILFALDIGTRSVTGVLIKKEKDSIELIDYCMIEHSERSMRDGQIHDVIAVAETIQEVKNKLEERTNQPLHKVSIAAAGRALKTVEATATIDLQEFPVKTQEDEKHLELSALQAAQEKLISPENRNSYDNYYCVGYSLLYYKLDEERIGSLIEQKGEKASADIIATFLPKVVVESLFAAVTKAGLEVQAMTLEPIAALHVLIPESMRRLNVVLIDIGAGTSDIAITDQGTVVSYGMVPIAGDEITETISDEYLLDFPEAERVKREIVSNQVTEIEDILGMKTNITYEELTLSIDEELGQLTSKIAEEVHSLNGKVPRAVMLVGGGSLTPQLPKRLAHKLGLPENRVAIRGIDAIPSFKTEVELPSGPQFVTPIGIAITANERPVQYTQVSVNNESIRLFDIDETTVGDALVQAGYQLNKYYGKPGLAAVITVNGKAFTVPGEFGKPPIIHVNAEKATVDTVIQQGDRITIEKGNDGREASMTLDELIGRNDSFELSFQGKNYSMGTQFIVNEAEKQGNYIVQDKDEIIWRNLATVQDFFSFYFPNKSLPVSFPVTINKETIQLPIGNTSVLINNQEASLDSKLTHGDTIELQAASTPTIIDLFEVLERPYFKKIEVTFNGEAIQLEQPLYTVEGKDGPLSIGDPLKARDRLTISEKENKSFVFQDVFRYVHLDLTNKTGNFRLYCNDSKAAFDTKIHDGDQLMIQWDA